MDTVSETCETLDTQMANSAPIQIHGRALEAGQPLTVSVPFERGRIKGDPSWRLTDQNGQSILNQHRVMARWLDGSVKWVNVIFQGGISLGKVGRNMRQDGVRLFLRPFNDSDYSLTEKPELQTPELLVRETMESVQISTGRGTFKICKSDQRLIATVEHSGKRWLGDDGCSIVGSDSNGLAQSVVWRTFKIVEAGPVSVTIQRTGTLGTTGLMVDSRLSFYAGSNRVRVQLDVTNPNRARHVGGFWDLGDRGSVLLQRLSLECDCASQLAREIHFRSQSTSPTQTVVANHLNVCQYSSGGERWQSKTHMNSTGVVPPAQRGFRVTGAIELDGHRASPLVGISGGGMSVAATIEEFWQKFPSALSVDGKKLTLDFWPRQQDQPHELQGGERNSRVFWLDFSNNESDPLQALEYVFEPSVAVVDADWIAKSGAIPFFPADESSDHHEREMMHREAIAGTKNFFKKREAIDEYGWRNFGDMWADHEEAYCDDAGPVISHYNNQYDLLHSLLIQFLLTGDSAWWCLADPLARHLMNIDIYHTQKDKAAYNGGLFWHTAHYHAAASCTHRSYSKSMHGKTIPVNGGGPSNEHNYSSGLWLYFLLTGDRQAYDSVVGLGDWVIAMDDGTQHLLGAVSDAPTGMASSTADLNYQGPGRGSGNSILVLTNAWIASGKRNYLAKAVELIRRTIHPRDDIAAHQLLNAEARWSYTVYLQSLFFFLEATASDKASEDIRSYAQESIRHYARWMLGHERLYLDRPELLEYPTETWAAQDLRKGVVLLMAVELFADSEMQSALQHKGRGILDAAWKQLIAFSTRGYTRPIAIALQQSYIEQFLASEDLSVSWCGRQMSVSQCPADFGSPVEFVPQKTIIVRQLRSPPKLVPLLSKLAHVRAWKHLLRRGRR